MKYPLVHVEWQDHHGDQSWQNREDVVTTPIICHSIGWLFKEDEHGVTIFGSYHTDVVGNVQYIVRSCITSLKTLRKGSSDVPQRPRSPKPKSPSSVGGLAAEPGLGLPPKRGEL